MRCPGVVPDLDLQLVRLIADDHVGVAGVRLSEEHAWVQLGAEDELELGQRVRVVPNHACVVVNLFDELQVTRNGELETTWCVAARGRSQ